MDTPVYQQLAQDIKARGITTVFGLMSDDTALFVAALDAMGVRFCAARHENNACAMAEGFAAATGELGIAILGRGPATANALHGAVYACRAGSRVLLVFGDNSTALRPPNATGPDNKVMDGQAVLHAAGIRTYVANNAEGARQVLADAIEATRSVPVALLLPTNVQASACTASEPAAPAAAQPKRLEARSATLELAASALARAQRPLIIAGVGAHRAGAREAIEQLADKTGAILATTLKAKDLFRGHPYHVGVIGSFSHAAGRRYMDQADCVLAIGAGLNMRTTSFGAAFPARAPVIHIDEDRSHVGRWAPADLAVIADARLAVEQLASMLPERPAAAKPFHDADTRDRLAQQDWATEFEARHTARTIDPRSLAVTLDRLLPPERNVVYDTGNFFHVAAYLRVPGPGHIKLSADFASIGLGFGTALGFGAARPGQPTVLFIGDGGFLMTMGELETVVREDIPLVIVLMNDCAYGAELHYLAHKSMPVATAQFVDVDYAPVAEAFGFQAATIRSMQDLLALEPLLREPQGPIFLDCKINGDVAAPFLLEALEAERLRAK